MLIWETPEGSLREAACSHNPQVQFLTYEGRITQVVCPHLTECHELCTKTYKPCELYEAVEKVTFLHNARSD